MMEETSEIEIPDEELNEFLRELRNKSTEAYGIECTRDLFSAVQSITNFIIRTGNCKYKEALAMGAMYASFILQVEANASINRSSHSRTDEK